MTDAVKKINPTPGSEVLFSELQACIVRHREDVPLIVALACVANLSGVMAMHCGTFSNEQIEDTISRNFEQGCCEAEAAIRKGSMQ